MSKFAQKIRDLEGFTGYASLYKMTPPLSSVKYDDTVDTAQYVIVSAANVPFSGPETYIFPANEEGEILSWGEREGSQRGVYSHEKVLSDLGYEVLPLAINGD